MRSAPTTHHVEERIAEATSAHPPSSYEAVGNAISSQRGEAANAQNREREEREY